MAQGSPVSLFCRFYARCALSMRPFVLSLFPRLPLLSALSHERACLLRLLALSPRSCPSLFVSGLSPPPPSLLLPFLLSSLLAFVSPCLGFFFVAPSLVSFWVTVTRVKGHWLLRLRLRLRLVEPSLKAKQASSGSQPASQPSRQPVSRQAPFNPKPTYPAPPASRRNNEPKPILKHTLNLPAHPKAAFLSNQPALPKPTPTPQAQLQLTRNQQQTALSHPHQPKPT